jgi:hypothetical protein
MLVAKVINELFYSLKASTVAQREDKQAAIRTAKVC